MKLLTGFINDGETHTVTVSQANDKWIQWMVGQADRPLQNKCT